MSFESLPTPEETRARLEKDAERQARQHVARVQRLNDRDEKKAADARGDVINVACSGSGQAYMRGRTLTIQFGGQNKPVESIEADFWVNGVLVTRSILVQ